MRVRKQVLVIGCGLAGSLLCNELADHADRHGDGGSIRTFGHGGCDAAVRDRDVSIKWQKMSIDRPVLSSTTRPVLPSMACK